MQQLFYHIRIETYTVPSKVCQQYFCRQNVIIKKKIYSPLKILSFNSLGTSSGSDVLHPFFDSCLNIYWY